MTRTTNPEPLQTPTVMVGDSSPTPPPQETVPITVTPTTVSANHFSPKPETSRPEASRPPLVNTPSLRKIPEISKAQMNEFKEAFRLFDKDGDGSITKEELGRVMRSLGQFAREEELQRMLEEVDINGDGYFSFEEFVEIVYNMGATTEEKTADQEEKELRDAFRVFDKHNRGYISASDLRAVLQCLGEDLSEEEIEDMIKEVDVDGDGRIDFNEFVHALGEPSDGFDEEEEEEDEKLMKIIKTIMSEEKAKKKEKAKKTGGGKDSLETTALRIAKLLKAQKLSAAKAAVSDDSEHAQVVKEEESPPAHPVKSREGGMSHFEQYLQSMSRRKDRSSKPSIASSSPIPLEERQSSSVSLLDKSQRYSSDRHYQDSSMSLLDKSQRHYSERTLQRPFPQRTPPAQGGYPDRPYPQRTPPTQGGYPDRPYPQRTPPTQGVSYPDRPFPQRTPPAQGYPERSFPQRTPPPQHPYSDRYPDRSFSQQGGGGSFTDSSTLERRRKVSGDSFSSHVAFLDSILANFPAVTTEDQRQRMRQLSLVFPLEYNAWYRERYMPTLERYKQAVNERKLVLRNRVTKQFGRHCVGKSHLNSLLKFEGRHIHEYNIAVGKTFHQTEDSNFLDDIELLTPFTFDNEDRKCFYGFVQSMIHRATSLSEQLLYQLIELMFKSKGVVELSDIGDLLLRSYSKVRGLQYLHYPDTLLWKPNNSSDVKLKLRQHAVNAQKQKAFQLALQSKDWALASVLASAPNSCLSQSELHQTFLSTIPDNDPLRPCFQMMFNQSVLVNGSTPIDLNDWGIHLAAILNNSTQHTLDTGAVLKLGHSLGDMGDYYGEQFCTLIVSGAPWSRFKLLGAPSTNDPASGSLAEIVTGRNILLSMTYENASKLGPQPAAYQFVQLQYMKYYFSLKLLRLGKIKLAVHFLHHAAEEVLSHLSEFCTPKHLPLLEQIVDLSTICAGVEARGLVWYSQLSAVLEQHLPSRRVTLAPLTQPDLDSNPGPSYSSDPQYTVSSQYNAGLASYGDNGPLSLNGAQQPAYGDTGPQSLPYNGAPGVPIYEGNRRPPSVPSYKPYGGLPPAAPGYQDPMARQTPIHSEAPVLNQMPRQTPIHSEAPVLNPMPRQTPIYSDAPVLNPMSSKTQPLGVRAPQEPLSNPAAPLRNTETRPAPPPQSQFFTPALIPDAESTYQQHLQDSESSTSMNVISLNSSFSYAQEDQKSAAGSNTQSISAVAGKPPSGASGGGGWFGFLKKNNPPAHAPAQNNGTGQQQDSSDARAPTPSHYPAPSYSAPPTNSGGGFMQPYSADVSNPSGQSSLYQPQQQSADHQSLS
uniref:Calmodulin-3 n=1 Tax=Cacopsylla melanoneura TaxID=428564 RepID=A0A8D8PP19_9HEMI